MEPAPLLAPAQPAESSGLASSRETSLRAPPEDRPKSSAAIPKSVTILRRSSKGTGREPVSI
ncbi:MAG: hypothetical protein ACRDTC_15790 [Pseudonocardiaceae bacterium]